MQNEKCCYCEKSIPESGHAKAVEHFQPRAIFKWRTNDWDNLLLACSQCNGAKSDKYPVVLSENDGETKIVYLTSKSKPKRKKAAILDPSHPDVNPEDHIEFDTNMDDEWYGHVSARNNSKLGSTTIDVTRINDDFYIKSRRRFLHSLLHTYDLILEATEAKDKERALTHAAKLELKMSSSIEHAAVARDFVRYRKLDKRFGLSIPVD